ncbi:hypothetical protein [Streptomyces sp. NBC_00503]|uniref:hypothetical protein n=1 Tax=Streptomyces sp. NBC_00503 TaxID=2903659 RepID=UPI002E7FE0EB|nr:hypothetical protein [Streptomyces sp. NBC_00503]WUD79251.1 hypothetical protein OG490_00930 [Streptomyces sp. NBC_00503]
MNGRRVRDIVSDVVAKVAPEEIVMVEGLLALDDAAVVQRLSGRGRRDPLGFGVTEVAALVTPVVWLVLAQVSSTIVGAAVEGAGRRTGRWLWRLVRRPQPPAVLPPLDRAQLAGVHQRVVEAAVRRGVAAERAGEVADAVVAALVLAEPDPLLPPGAPEMPGPPEGTGVPEGAGGGPAGAGDAATDGPR